MTLLAKLPDHVMDMNMGDFKRSDAMLLSVPAAEMGCAGFVADAAPVMRQTAPLRLAKPMKKVQFRACFTHWKLHCDKHKGLICDGGNIGKVYGDINALQRCCIMPSAVPVATKLVLDKWTRNGDSRFSDSMGGYVTSCGGLVPRASANVLPGCIMVADDNNGPEGFHSWVKRGLGVKKSGGDHLTQTADLLSSRSLFDQTLGYDFDKDIWNGHVFTAITQNLSLEFYQGTEHPVTINPMDCIIGTSMQLDALDMQKHTRVANEDPVLWNLTTDLVKKSQDVILVPTPSLVGHVVLCHPYNPMFPKDRKSPQRAQGVTGVVTSHKTIMKYVQAKCSDQTPSWLAKFKKVIEDPEGATAELSLTFDQFCEWSTSFDILIVVTDAAEKAQIIARLRRGIPGPSSGKICNGAEIDDEAVLRHGLVKYANAHPPAAPH